VICGLFAIFRHVFEATAPVYLPRGTILWIGDIAKTHGLKVERLSGAPRTFLDHAEDRLAMHEVAKRREAQSAEEREASRRESEGRDRRRGR
jgi:hypothetical protein